MGFIYKDHVERGNTGVDPDDLNRQIDEADTMEEHARETAAAAAAESSADESSAEGIEPDDAAEGETSAIAERPA